MTLVSESRASINRGELIGKLLDKQLNIRKSQGQRHTVVDVVELRKMDRGVRGAITPLACSSHALTKVIAHGSRVKGTRRGRLTCTGGFSTRPKDSARGLRGGGTGRPTGPTMQGVTTPGH
jgi:hypothetical protein